MLKNFFTRELQPRPFRLLLHLEWIVLGFIALMSVGTFGVKANELPYLLLAIALLGLMGLKLPTSNIVKLFYSGLEFTLIGIVTVFLQWNLYRVALLMVIVVIRSCLMYKLTGRLITAGILFLFYPISVLPISLLLVLMDTNFLKKSGFSISYIHPMTPDGGLVLSPKEVTDLLLIARNWLFQMILESTFLFGLTLVFVLLFVNVLVKERQGLRKLAMAYEQLYQYSLKIEDQAILKERTRIAREIYDSLGHLLTAQSIQLESALMYMYSNLEEAKYFVKDGKRLGSNALNSLRQAVKMLHSEPLLGRTLSIAIDDLIKDFIAIKCIDLKTEINLQNSLPNSVQIAVYRILSEALTNIHKHSNANQVQIKLSMKSQTLPKGNSVLYLEIEDNGQGFNPAENFTGFGLRGMKIQAESAGGSLELISHPEFGCRILAIFPLIDVFYD